MSSKREKLVPWDKESESRKIFEVINNRHISMLIAVSRPELYLDYPEFPDNVPQHLLFPGRGLWNKPKAAPKRREDHALLEAKEFLGGDIEEPRKRSHFSGSYNMGDLWKQVDEKALVETPKDQKKSRQSSLSSSSSSYSKHLYAGSIASKPSCTPEAKGAAGIDIDYSGWLEGYELPKYLQAKRSTQSLERKNKASPQGSSKKLKRSLQRKSTKIIPDSRSNGIEKCNIGRLDIFSTSSSSESEDEKQVVAAVDAQQEGQEAAKLNEAAESSEDGAITPRSNNSEEINDGSANEKPDKESESDQEAENYGDSDRDEDYHPSTSVAARFKKPVVKADVSEPMEEPFYSAELDELKITLRKEESIAVLEKVM